METETEVQPTPSLPLPDYERAAIDAAIDAIAKTGRERGVYAERPRPSDILFNEDLCRKADALIVETLGVVKKVVSEDTAEKFFDRMAKVIDDWKDPDEQLTLAVVFFRLMDTMRFFIAYRGKYRGKNRTSQISKEEAHAELKARGLTKR